MMKFLKLIMCGALLGAVISSNGVAANALVAKADGWHTWQVDEPGTAQIYVKMIKGVPTDFRVRNSHCQEPIKSEITDHGLVSAAENLDWFRAVIEGKHLDMDVREEALFGLVLSESDVAFAYLDRLLTQN